MYTHTHMFLYGTISKILAKQSAEQYNSMLPFVSKPCEMKYIELYTHILIHTQTPSGRTEQNR